MLKVADSFVLRTFGTASLVRADGAPVELPRGRLALLSLLAVAGDRGVSRERICDLLWPDVPTPRARHSLEQMLSVLRSRLGAGTVRFFVAHATRPAPALSRGRSRRIAALERFRLSGQDCD